MVVSTITTKVAAKLLVAVALTVAVIVATKLSGSSVIAHIVAATVAVAITLLGAYVGHRTLGSDEKYKLIWLVVTKLTARGTSFNGADLTEADFTQATLKNTDFRNSILTRTCWHQAEGMIE